MIMRLSKEEAEKLLRRHESLRWHEDWWGKCRTCKWWTGDRAKMTPGKCLSEASDLYETETEGHCKEWDSFDIDTAIALMEQDEVP